MATRTHRNAIVAGVLATAILSLALQNAAYAATRISYSTLVPVTANTVAFAPNPGGCPDPDSNARVTDPYQAQWLKLVAMQTNHSDVQIQIDLDSVGNLLDASVAKSSGYTFLDQQALIAARNSKYAPEVRNCNSFKRSYFVDISFDSPAAVLPETGGASGRHPAQ
jgi:TonB family protein